MLPLLSKSLASSTKRINGKISWEELWAAARPSVDEVLQVLKAIKEQRGLSIERLLLQHDSSGDDKLAFSEFQKLLQSLSIDIDQETAAEVFKRLDRDGDKQLSLRALFGFDSGGRQIRSSVNWCFWIIQMYTCICTV